MIAFTCDNCGAKAPRYQEKDGRITGSFRMDGYVAEVTIHRCDIAGHPAYNQAHLCAKCLSELLVAPIPAVPGDPW